ncbi:hypothetical protein Tco_0562136 [Tanacetum coccineum]
MNCQLLVMSANVFLPPWKRLCIALGPTYPLAEIDRLLAIPSPPPSPLSPWSSPLPQIPSPPLLVSSPVPVSPPPLPTSPTYPLGYRAAMIRLRAKTPSTSYPLPLSTPPSGTPPLLPIPLPTPSPPLLLPSTDHRADMPEVFLPPWVDYGFVATLDDEIRCDPKRDVGYRITDTWDEMLVGMPGAPATDDTELGRRLTDFVTTVRQDTDEIYGRLDDAHDDRSLMSGRLNMLFRDRCAHARTALLMEREARLSPLRAADHARQAQLVETLRLMITLQTQKMAPKRATRSTQATTTTTTSVTNAQLKALIDQGVADALAARDADRSMNGDDSHNSGTGVRRQAPPARECTYPDFMK